MKIFFFTSIDELEISIFESQIEALLYYRASKHWRNHLVKFIWCGLFLKLSNPVHSNVNNLVSAQNSFRKKWISLICKKRRLYFFPLGPSHSGKRRRHRQRRNCEIASGNGSATPIWDLHHKSSFRGKFQKKIDKRRFLSSFKGPIKSKASPWRVTPPSWRHDICTFARFAKRQKEIKNIDIHSRWR